MLVISNCPISKNNSDVLEKSPNWAVTKYRNITYTVSPHMVSAESMYIFLNLENQRSQYIRPKVTVHIRMWVLFERGSYMRKYGKYVLTCTNLFLSISFNKLPFRFEICRKFWSLSEENMNNKVNSWVSMLKYSSDEIISSFCKCSILLGLTFVEIKKYFTNIILSFKF